VAAGRLLKPGDDVEERGLAAAGGSDDADKPPFCDSDVDAIDRLDAACSRRMKYVRDVVEFDPHRPGHRGELHRSRDRRIRSRPVLHSSKSCFAVGASRKNQQRRRIWR
jgi:hypothetical protein